MKKGKLGIHTYKFIEYQNNGNGIDAIIEPVAGGQQELILASKLVKTTLGGKRNTKKGRKSKKTKRSKKSGKTRKSKK